MCTTPFPRLSCVWDQKCGHVLIKEKINVILSENCLTLAESLLFLAMLGGTLRWSHGKKNLDLGTKSTQRALSELKEGKFWVLSSFLLPAPRAGSHLSIRGKSEKKKAEREERYKRRRPQGFSQRSQSGCQRVAAALSSPPMAGSSCTGAFCCRHPCSAISFSHGPWLFKQLKPTRRFCFLGSVFSWVKISQQDVSKKKVDAIF